MVRSNQKSPMRKLVLCAVLSFSSLPIQAQPFISRSRPRSLRRIAGLALLILSSFSYAQTLTIVAATESYQIEACSALLTPFIAVASVVS
jgi:hypothetical protein